MKKIKSGLYLHDNMLIEKIVEKVDRYTMFGQRPVRWSTVQYWGVRPVNKKKYLYRGRRLIDCKNFLIQQVV